MRVYQSKVSKFSGTDFHEVWRKAAYIVKKVKRKGRRQPYVRCAYFDKDKVFFNLFWDHLFEKAWRDRMRRLKYFAAAVDLIERNRIGPCTKEDPNKPGELLHRFAGLTKEKELFYIQIKEDRSSGKKHLISIFPAETERKALR